METKIFTEDGKFFFCECGHKVSVDAKACPSCGDAKAKEKALKRLPITQRPIGIVKILFLSFAGFILFLIFSGSDSNTTYSSNSSANRDCMNGPNSVSRLVRQGVIDKLNDPDSFEYVGGSKLGDREYEIVFRAKNAFGGLVVNSAVVKVDGGCIPTTVRFNQ